VLVCIVLQVREFEQMMTHMQPVFKPLLKPHLEDLEKKVAPGLFILTWASMNIDGYLHRFKQVRPLVQQLLVRHTCSPRNGCTSCSSGISQV
jgi:phage gp36-like protein